MEFNVITLPVNASPNDLAARLTKLSKTMDIQVLGMMVCHPKGIWIAVGGEPKKARAKSTRAEKKETIEEPPKKKGFSLGSNE